MDVYKIVTDKIIKQLENGCVPWKKSWRGSPDGAFNRVTKKPYSLLNQMLLKHDGEYMTFNQISKLGGRVKKNEKAEQVFFFKFLEVEEVNKDGELIKKTVPCLKYFSVFHISQTTGIEPLNREKVLKPLNPINEAEKVLNDYVNRERIKFENKLSDKAYYSPSADIIHLPTFEQFESAEEYYSTAFHEASHSTGHKDRLNRFDDNTKIAPFGSADYSKEELIAEMSSCFILNKLGIETKDTFNNNTAYIKSWLSVLKNDNKFIVSAATKAQKATEYIMGEGL